MDYYLMYIADCAGTPSEIVGITRWVATMKRYQHQFDVKHEKCKDYNKTDRECAFVCNARFVVDTVKEVE